MTTCTDFSIAVLPGDGIGPEVIDEAIKVLKAVEQKLDQVCFELHDYSVGAREYLRSGDPLPPDTLNQLRQHHAILLGAMGLPDIRWASGVEMTPQIDIREKLDLYCGLRPIYLYHELHTPLKKFRAGEIDLVIIRESTEGLFSSRLQNPALDADSVDDTLRITRAGSARIFRTAFREAQRRRKCVTLVDKANVLPSMAFFRRLFDEIAVEFQDVKTERVYVDAASLFLLQNPRRFDVIVTENMFGDILSDLAAGLVGGMGMAPSADIGDRHAVFQPSHGSAPDIAGRGIANPIGTILSVAMMLDWLEHPELRRGAAMIRSSTKKVLANQQNRTPDLGGSLSTTDMGKLIVESI